MISLKILEMNRCMGKLLKGDSFDSFLLKEGFLRTNMEFRFQGKQFLEYFEAKEQEQMTQEYVFWKEIKPIVFELVKGKRTPLAFSFTLFLTKEQRDELFVREAVTIGEDNPTLFLQIRFEHGVGRMITGTARNIFTLDRTLEEVWDLEVKRLLHQMEIVVEQE